MDKCSMIRVHGMVNKLLCSTFTVVSLACSSTPWKMSCVQDLVWTVLATRVIQYVLP